jgi:hypothetical protein
MPARAAAAAATPLGPPPARAQGRRTGGVVGCVRREGRGPPRLSF